MSLQNLLIALPTEKLKELFNEILDAGIAHENKGKAKAFFRRNRDKSSGKLKKIYAALAKCSEGELERVFKRISDS